MLHIWPSLPHVQQHEFVLQVIDKHRLLAFKERRPRFCTNSLEHRLMLRSLQCLLCLTSVVKDSVGERQKAFSITVARVSLQSLLKTIYDYIAETLMTENEPSLRLLAEWILVRLISEDRTARLNDLYGYLQNVHRQRTGTVCAWISIASHVINLLSNRAEQVREHSPSPIERHHLQH